MAVIAAALVLAGCGEPSTEALIASAKDYIAQADAKAAMIQLRNARQKAPDNAEVRFLLGRALLDSGDAAGAELELRRALDLKHDADATVPLVAQALVAQGEFRKVIGEYANTKLVDAKARSALATTLAIAHLAQRDIKQGRAALDVALDADPANVRALLVHAQLAAMGNDLAGALAALDQALAKAPHDPDATVFKAGLLAMQGRRDDGIRIMAEAAAAHPTAIQLHFALISMRVGAGQVKEAEADLAQLRKAAAGDFRTVYSDALIALAKNQPARARDLTQKLTASRPDHVPSLYLGALANYQLRSYAVAEEALRKVIAKAPDDPGPRRVLVATLVKTGRLRQAVETLDSAMKRIPDDPVLLRLAGETRVLSGNPGEAATYYERAATLDRDGHKARLRLAQIRLATGDTTRALDDLERLSASDDSKIDADLAVFATHMRKREFGKALAAVSVIEKKQPGALAHELRGSAYAAQRKLKDARGQFEKALEIEPQRLSAARNLAMLDLQEGKAADARARYEKIIAGAPKNDQPLIALAEILAFSGAPPDEVKSALDRAIAANPMSTAPRLALIAHHRRIGDATGALAAARAAATALPAEPSLVEVLGVLQLASGQIAQARESFTRLAQLLPQSPAPLLRLAEANLRAQDYPAALELQRRAIALQPDHVPSLVALATTYLASGKPTEALDEARRMQRERPKQAVGYALESEILIAQKKFTEAANALRQALARQPNAALAARLYSILVSSGKPSEANAFVDRWMKDHPKDIAFLSLVGQERQVRNEQPGAISAYRAALAIDPDNVVVLNNLAWMLNAQARPEARELAERAHELAPLNANVVDTYGSVLVAQGEPARGLALLQMANNLAPADPRIRLSLARALAKTGDKAGARRELERIVSSNARSPAKAEAEALLKQL